MTLPGGWAGTDGTVVKMQEMATGKWGSRSPKIRALAINILHTRKVPEKNYVAEMVAIHNWVRDNIRYTKDVNGQETLCYPEDTAFNTKAGDCDDKSLLEAALLGSVGIASRFVTVGLTPFKYDHVYLQAKPKDTWIALDPIMRDKPAGWEVPDRAVKVRKVFPENIPTEMAMSGLNGLNGPLDWYVGYQGGGFTHSHLSPSPQPGKAGPAAPYVVMDAMLDDDRSVQELCRNPIAFPQNDLTAAQMRPRLGQLRPKLINMTLPPAQVRANIQRDNAASGVGGLMGPDDLADLADSTGIDRQMPYPNMQRPPVAQVPEGIDAQFLRPNMVLRTDKGDAIVYKGMYSLAERPPIRPYNGLAGTSHGAPMPGMGHVRSGALPGMGGVFGVGRGVKDMMPGMGGMPARSISGPGVSELADLADDAIAPLAPAAAPASGMPKILAFAALAYGAYLLLKKKRT